MEIYVKLFWFFYLANKTPVFSSPQCGCKSFSPCYAEMLEALQDRDEEACVENASIGASTLMVYFQALRKYCPDIVGIYSDDKTFENRQLYQIVIHKNDDNAHNDFPPIIFVEAGQDAGLQAVELALYLIEQLLACQENEDMIRKVRWVILPCTNPDGMEYARFDRPQWKKNAKINENGLVYGVDITRNFDYKWSECQKITNMLSPAYQGPAPASENETLFVENVLAKYKKDVKAYLSLRQNGHSVLYPYAYSQNSPAFESRIVKVAGDIAAKVNQRGGHVQQFVNDSIFNANAQPRCGHSVDYVYEQGVPLAYEMRVYHNTDLSIISKFSVLPAGYTSTLRQSYLSGIKELYNAVIEGTKKHKK